MKKSCSKIVYARTCNIGQPIEGGLGMGVKDKIRYQYSHVAWCTAQTNQFTEGAATSTDFHGKGGLECQHRYEPLTTQMKRLVTVL